MSAFALALWSGVALAADCNCEQYRYLVGTSALGQSVFQIGREAYDNVGREFAGDQKRRLIDRLGADAYSIVPAQCREYLLGSAGRLELFVRGVLDQSNPSYFADSTEPMTLFGAYKKFSNFYLDTSACGPNPTQACLTKAHVTAFKKSRDQLAAATPADAALIFGSPGGPFDGLTKRQVSILQAYNGVLGSKDGDAALKYLGSIKDQLTTEQKLTLVQLVGARFDADYDNARIKAGAQAKGVVTITQMLDAARDNTSEGLSGSSKELAGVCRDISSAQGQMLERLGFKNTYVVSEALRSGAMHVTVITQDPEYSALYRIDYGARRDMAGGDARALREGSHDVSLNYRVFKPGGIMVADVQSEFGKFMTEAAGFSITDVDPFAAPHGNLVAANIDLNRTGTAQARVGFGNDGTGASYVFGGVTVHWGQNGIFPGAIGLVFATQQTDGSLIGSGYGGQPTGDQLNLDLVYLQLEQKVRSHELALTKNIQARIEAMATGIFAVSRQRDGSSAGAVGAQGDLRLSTQVRVDQSAWNDRVRATYVAGASISPGILDIRNNYIAQPVIPVLNGLFLSAEGRMRLSQTPEGRAYLIAATTVLLDELGLRGRAEAGIFGDKLGASVRIEGRLTDNTALFQDGSARVLSGGVHWNPNKVMRVSVIGGIPLEKGTNQGYSIMGTMSVTH